METVTVKKTKIKELLISFLTAILFSVFLPVFVYTNNIEEADFIDVLPLILIFAGIGAGIFGVLFLCFKKNIFLAEVASVLLILMFSNYAFIEKAIVTPFPYVEAGSVIIIILCVITVIVMAMKKFVPDSVRELIPPVLLLVISALIALNVIMALPKGIQKLTAPKNVTTEPVEAPADVPAVTDDLPNVYYLIFDEYSNSEMIKKYYDYDNSAFDRYLEEKGFTVSQNTMNGSIGSPVIITNYMYYDYIVDDNTDIAEINKLKDNNKLVNLFSSMDYKIIGVGESEFVGVPSATQNTVMRSATKDGNSIDMVILANTVYKIFYDYRKIDMAVNINNAVNYFNEEKLTQNNGDNVFTLSYICSPHSPFLFDENGNLNDNENYDNWSDKQYYLNQYIYITKQMQKIVDNILEYDEDCVIILQSDHGARALPEIALEDKMKPLNAVYYRGEDISEIEGQSGVNTVRLVLNRLFGMDLEVVEVNE